MQDLSRVRIQTLQTHILVGFTDTHFLNSTTTQTQRTNTQRLHIYDRVKNRARERATSTCTTCVGGIVGNPFARYRKLNLNLL